MTIRQRGTVTGRMASNAENTQAIRTALSLTIIGAAILRGSGWGSFIEKDYWSESKVRGPAPEAEQNRAPYWLHQLLRAAERSINQRCEPGDLAVSDRRIARTTDLLSKLLPHADALEAAWRLSGDVQALAEQLAEAACS